ncbi:AP-5 complex subunit mu-1 isoform X1 [Stegostoma tigrinum]|uniref:AP-5 complex subunit mu-1 isoform X1 n=1 Tax=Stegostoma tigrinum TaxID=3053191 RepID=UPI00202B0931|nr:AP-5 complex subunit mu-1 isoform X1 [Stegostoma tigrinum]
MSVRAIWLLGLEKGAASVKMSRRYPTVEKRARNFNGKNYTEVPEDKIFLNALLTELSMTELDKNFVEHRDSCCRINRTSAYEIAVGDGVLWPVLVMTQNAILYACLPLVEQSLTPRPPLFSLRGISSAFALLSGLMTFLTMTQRSEPEMTTKLTQISAMLMHACPLGTPTDTDFGLMQTLSGSLVPQTPISSAQLQKQPAWKPGIYKGKPQVNVCVTEQIRSMQYDKNDVIDVWQEYGTVTCKCDLEGIMPTVTVSLNLPINGSPLQDILVHPCVSAVDSTILAFNSVDDVDDSLFNGPYKFSFTPPLDVFKLCYYTSQVPIPPILGCYQMKEEEQYLKITVNLKLHESVKNGFEYCEAHIPFFNRGPIIHAECKVSHGQLEVSREKSLLVWVIGQKFPKSLEVSLTGTVIFPAFGVANHSVQLTDPFCTGLTAYVKLYFRIPDYTLTGCYVDQHSVQVYSSAKPKIVTLSVATIKEETAAFQRDSDSRSLIVIDKAFLF